MKYRRLGNTDLELSIIGLGTYQFGGEWGKSVSQLEANRILDSAKDNGINFIDTAECYGDHLSEKLVGNAVSTNRSNWIIATKFGHKFNSHMDRTPNWEPKKVRSQLEKSLKALKTDYIDLYQFHSGSNEEFNTDGLWTELDKQVQKGKIRYIGISLQNALLQNNDMFQIYKAKEVNARAVQVVYNIVSRDAENILFPLCEKESLGVIARVPLARGYLSGKYSQNSQFPKNDIRSEESMNDKERIFKEVKKIRSKIPKNKLMVQYALKWILKNKNITTCLTGCKNADQLGINAQVGDLI